jgi:hypothetical protein
MVQLVRRFLLVVALMFWQGGFTFYGAVVVPIGADVHGSHLKQGFITRRVTDYLNLAGAIALPILAWDLVAVADTAPWRRWLRWLALVVASITLALLVWLHNRLDGLLDSERLAILDRQAYLREHELYLHISTVKWIACLVGLGLSLWAWRAEDATRDTRSRRTESG